MRRPARAAGRIGITRRVEVRSDTPKRPSDRPAPRSLAEARQARTVAPASARGVKLAAGRPGCGPRHPPGMGHRGVVADGKSCAADLSSASDRSSLSATRSTRWDAFGINIEAHNPTADRM